MALDDDSIFGSTIFFHRRLFPLVMEDLGGTLPDFVQITFNFTDDSEEAECWMQLFRRADSPEIDMDAYLIEAIKRANTAA